MDIFQVIRLQLDQLYCVFDLKILQGAGIPYVILSLRHVGVTHQASTHLVTVRLDPNEPRYQIHCIIG